MTFPQTNTWLVAIFTCVYCVLRCNDNFEKQISKTNYVKLRKKDVVKAGINLKQNKENRKAD